MMNRFSIGLVGVCISLLSVEVSAQQAPSIEQRFRMLDADRNGVISLEEASDARAAEFRRLDRNGDGRVNASEFTDRALALSEFDADRSGDLSLREYVDRHLAMFKKFDQDGKPGISLGEFRQAQETLRP